MRSFFRPLLLWAITLALTACSAWGPGIPGEKISRNVVFASPDGRNLHVDLYVPRSDNAVPVVVWIFGGSWKIGSKGYHLNVRGLSRHGIAVAAIQYRLSGSATYPAQLEDCEAALQWLRIHGREYGIDPTRIGIAGESAGGHLAALAGTAEGASRVRAVLALYPPTNLVSLGRMYANSDRPSDIERLLGGPIERRRSLAASASPVYHVTSGSPPFLIFHGQEDQLVPLSQSQELHQRLRGAGVESRLEVVPGKGHWFLLNDDQVTEAARFFLRHFQAVR